MRVMLSIASFSGSICPSSYPYPADTDQLPFAIAVAAASVTALALLECDMLNQMSGAHLTCSRENRSACSFCTVMDVPRKLTLMIFQRRSEGYSLGIFFFQAEDGIRDLTVTGVQTCALPI